MSTLKDETTASHTESPSMEVDGNNQSVFVANEALARFQKHQHSMTVKEALKENWKPLIWCGYMFFVCIMYGYDALAGSVVISILEFRKDFGFRYGDEYVVSAAWQLGFQAAFFAGLMLGGFAVGPVVGRWGRKKTIAAAYVINIAGVFLQYFCTTPAQFFRGKLLTGFPLGAFATIAPTYASEMSPLAVRGAITGGMNLAIVIGNTVGYGVLREAGKYTGKDSYRILFAVQWGFVGVCLAILPFLPESPYWYIAQDKEQEARSVLAKLHKSSFDIDGRIAEIRSAMRQEHEAQQSQGSFKDCFNAQNRKRTGVAMMAFVIQNFSGMGWIVGYMSYFLQLAGMSAAKSFDLTVGISGIMVVGNLCSWFLVEYLGRRGTMLYGAGVLFVALLVIAVMAVAANSQAALTAQIVMMGIWAFVYQGTIGAVAWPVASENATSSLRTPAQALCTIANALTASIWGLSLPYAVNPDQGNLQGKIGFIYAALLLFCIVFVYFYVPETKGRTYSEIDELWQIGVPPRKWSSHELVVVEAGTKLRHNSDNV
ncbi:general substrate transporter [Plectosphaerella plurivora]|uniref:General substrate transporter n=1 Tax=Plectosphaerella plurivora TaxID=936078 RepID=A0A9P8VCF9_9PEZI|nr:general substrate transporter [Plectosphaerella plurivora]